MIYIIPRLPIDNFDWSTWRRGANVWEKLDIHPRWHSIIDTKELLRRYAVGYIEGYKLFCRPENEEVAVMFLVDDVFGWTHFRKEEFEEVFGVR